MSFSTSLSGGWKRLTLRIVKMNWALIAGTVPSCRRRPKRGPAAGVRRRGSTGSRRAARRRRRRRRRTRRSPSRRTAGCRAKACLACAPSRRRPAAVGALGASGGRSGWRQRGSGSRLTSCARGVSIGLHAWIRRVVDPWISPRAPADRTAIENLWSPVRSVSVGDEPQPTTSTSTLGPNAWLVDEMYEQYLDDPSSVSENWRDFFADYKRDVDHQAPVPAPPAAAPPPAAPTTSNVAAAPTGPGARGAPAPPRAPNPAAPAPAPAPDAPAPSPRAPASSAAAPAAARAAASAPAAPSEPAPDAPPGEPLRGAAARIVQNMTASLDVPTATSFRDIPAKLLEVNRRIINGYLGRTRGGKISFTHVLGFAIVRAIADTAPVMKSAFATDADGKPRVVRNEHVNLGLAVDVEQSDGRPTLLVPVVRDADTLDFRGFWGSYEDLIRKVRSNKISPDDFAGANVTLTNPGTIGTVQSVPRLMPTQGVIVGVGAIDYP